MIQIIEGIKFLSPFYNIEYTVHKVTDEFIEVIGQGELIQYTRKEFDEINNDLTEYNEKTNS